MNFDGTTERPANLVELRALESHMEAGAVGGNPTWLAFLAIWLQTMSGLDLCYIILSQPVKLFDGWIRFFCKPEQGDRAANTEGFYWGTPSSTTSGYSWAREFLTSYLRREQSIDGEEACMIFRTDTHDRIPDDVVRAFTSSAVASSCLGRSAACGQTTTFQWLGMLPAMSCHLNLQMTRLEVSRIDEEETISSEYYDSTAPGCVTHMENFGRIVKLICVQAFVELASEDFQSFDDVAVEQWDAIAAAAISHVNDKTISFWPLWSNAKFSESPYPQEANPGEKAFTQQARNQQRPYQLGAPLPAHHGPASSHCQPRPPPSLWHEHPGTRVLGTPVHETYFSKNPWRTYEKVYRMTDEAISLSTTDPGYVIDDSIIKRFLPELRANRDVGQGNRRNPERPTMIAKVCEGKGKGELWLGPLPTWHRMGVIMETNYSIQICCLSMEPEAVRIDERESGTRIPGAFVFHCDAFNHVTRTSDFEALQEFAITSMRQGNNVYVHCVAGIRRAVVVAAILSTISMNITLATAMDMISQTRNVDWRVRYDRMAGRWMDEMHQKYLHIDDTTHLRHLRSIGHAVVHMIADGSPVTEAPHADAASHPHSPEYDGEQPAAAADHAPLPPAEYATMPWSDQHSDFDQCMTTLRSLNPQEANPEGAETPSQPGLIQVIQSGDGTTHSPVESVDDDPSQEPLRTTSLAERGTVIENIPFGGTLPPMLTPLPRAAPSSTPPRGINLGEQGELF